MHAAYEGLPDDVKVRLRDATALHDFEKFWEHMRRDKASTRPPLTEEQRRKRPTTAASFVRSTAARTGDS
jgi:taurine dioxygenase